MKREEPLHRYYYDGEMYKYTLYQLVYGYKDNFILHPEMYAGEETGIYDTNYLLIFTGDIVSVPYIDPSGRLTTEENYKSEVFFINGTFAIKSESGATHVPLSKWLTPDITTYVSNVGEVTTYKDKAVLTIIGNIHEHPHLLTHPQLIPMNKEIETKELRIGNYITFDGGIPTRVYELTEYFINDCHPKETNIQGIPLSPAILEKSGFVDDGNVKQSVYVYKDKNLSFSIAESQLEDNEMYISCDNAFSGINTVTGVKYLHQIQNIVSALTGQELQITL